MYSNTSIQAGGGLSLVTSMTRSLRPPCGDAPHDWDLDIGTPDTWRSAVEVCLDCPLRTPCARQAEALIERSDGPRAMIWAGVAYDNVGRVVEDLDRYRIAPIDHQRPMRIIRTGERQVYAAPAVTVPRRHFTLGRPLAPTGSEG